MSSEVQPSPCLFLSHMTSLLNLVQDYFDYLQLYVAKGIPVLRLGGA